MAGSGRSDRVPHPAIRSRRSRPGRPAGPPPRRRRRRPGTFGVRILGVSEVTRAIRGAVRSDPRLADLWVEGEIGRVTISSAGHAYFALKDERNQLQCVWFRDDRFRSAFEAQAGLRVVAHGRIDLFEPQGALQLYVESIQPAGLGDLTLRFEALKARLAAEGLFDAARKRPLPHVRRRSRSSRVRPARSGRTSATSSARRWPLTRVVLVAAQVQGDAAPASLVGALRKVERYAAASIAAGRPDEAPSVTILARGGGSLEDLWAFNDEARRPRRRRALGAGRVRGRPRGRRHAGRFRSRRPRPDAVGRRGDRRPRPHRVPGRGPERRAPPRWRGARRVSGRPLARSPPNVGRSIGSARVAQLASARERVGLLARPGDPRDRGRARRRGADESSGSGSGSGRRFRVGWPATGHGWSAATCSTASRSGASRSPGPRSEPRRRRWPSSARRRRSTAATRSSAAPTMAGSCAIPADAAPGTRLALRVAQGELPATADDR